MVRGPNFSLCTFKCLIIDLAEVSIIRTCCKLIHDKDINCDQAGNMQ